MAIDTMSSTKDKPRLALRAAKPDGAVRKFWAAVVTA
jgi:hypothetical protein